MHRNSCHEENKGKFLLAFIHKLLGHFNVFHLITQAYRRMKIRENMNMVGHTIDSIQFTFVFIDDAPDVFIQIVFVRFV